MSTTTYFDTIPIAQVPIPIHAPEPVAHRPSILVVDDERMIADTLAAIFNCNGYSAVPAYDAASAIEMAAALKPDLLITDVVMPGQSGVDLALLMRELCPGCSIILFSGQASTADLLAPAITAGHSFELLTKPLHPVAMLAKVAEALPARASLHIN